MHAWTPSTSGIKHLMQSHSRCTVVTEECTIANHSMGEECTIANYSMGEQSIIDARPDVAL